MMDAGILDQCQSLSKALQRLMIVGARRQCFPSLLKEKESTGHTCPRLKSRGREVFCGPRRLWCRGNNDCNANDIWVGALGTWADYHVIFICVTGFGAGAGWELSSSRRFKEPISRFVQYDSPIPFISEMSDNHNRTNLFKTVLIT
jgi:hypothetical protein